MGCHYKALEPRALPIAVGMPVRYALSLVCRLARRLGHPTWFDGAYNDTLFFDLSSLKRP